ncbi:MAG: amidohydrolase family protein [Planctomycetota bacterium]|nr:amidohydrolase family protein [Planctomycetota bacterium]
MRVIDFHAHYFGRVFFETLAAQSPLEGDVESKLSRLVERTGLQLPSANNAEHARRWISELDRNQVDHMCTFASVPEEVPAVVEAARESNGRLSAFAIVDPRVDGAAAKVRTLLEKRAIRGVLLFPAMHHYAIGGSAAKPLLDALDEHAGVCFVHCGVLVVKLRDLLKLPRPQDLAYADPLAIVPAASAHPRVSFVIPHFGAGFFRETLMTGVSAANVFVDTSSSNGWRATQWPKPTLSEVFARTLEVFGHERILFGTDSNTFPAGWRRDRFEEQHAALRTLGTSVAAEEAIFAGNARRILGLPDSA